MIGLGRLRGPGLGQDVQSVNYFLVYLTVTNMDPVSWSSSDPARQLGLEWQGSMPDPGRHIFSSQVDQRTAMTILSKDPRVGWVELVDRRPIEGAVVAAMDVPQGMPVQETRPEPGKPEWKLPGYVPKMPGSNGGRLSWDEKLTSKAPAQQTLGGLGMGASFGGPTGKEALGWLAAIAAGAYLVFGRK